MDIDKLVGEFMDKQGWRWEGEEDTGWCGSAVLEVMLIKLCESAVESEVAQLQKERDEAVELLQIFYGAWRLDEAWWNKLGAFLERIEADE